MPVAWYEQQQRRINTNPASFKNLAHTREGLFMSYDEIHAVIFTILNFPFTRKNYVKLSLSPVFFKVNYVIGSMHFELINCTLLNEQKVT